jgi:hypothetical protein
MLRVVGLTFLLAAALSAGKPKHAGPYKMSDQSVEITATPILDREEIKELLGSDLGGHYVLMNVTVTPKFGKEIDLRRDDFTLKTDKDGDRAKPFVASQIAGKGALVVSEKAAGTSGGPQFGSPYDYPAYSGGVGGGPTQVTEAQAKMQNSAKGDSPLMKVLNEKIMPEKKTDSAPVSGLLYFPMEKQKQKDLELIYDSPDGKLRLRFR